MALVDKLGHGNINMLYHSQQIEKQNSEEKLDSAFQTL